MGDGIDDFELNLCKFITTKSPKLRDSGNIGNLLVAFCRKKEFQLENVCLDLMMILDHHECVGQILLFMPQLYDFDEISYIKKMLKAGGIFLYRCEYRILFTCRFLNC